MVTLTLSTAKGNQGSRFFPYIGYLGLTPVRVEGIVRTKLDEDGRPLPAKALTVSVRCYEVRLVNRTRALHSTCVVDYTQTLWSKPPTADWADIADSEYNFKITLPKRCAGFSTANFQDYRTFWRVEAALEHIPMIGVGNRLVRYYDLPLVRYDVPSDSSSSRPPPLPTDALTLKTNKPRAPVIRYNISTPSISVGPNDLVFTSLHLQPLDSGVYIRSASLIVERRIDMHSYVPSLPSPSPSFTPASPISLATSSGAVTPIDLPLDDNSAPATPRALLSPHPYPDLSPSPSGSSTTVGTSGSSSSTRPLLAPTAPLAIPRPSSPTQHSPVSTLYEQQSHHSLPAKTLTTNIAAAECTFPPSPSSFPPSVVSKTLTLQWPAARSHSRWALGETLQSATASVRFFVKVRLIVSSSNGTESLELEEQELKVVATNETERRVALAKWNEQRELARSKSKSPRRKKDEESGTSGMEGEAQLPSPPRTPSKVGTTRKASHSSLKPATASGSYGRAPPVPTIPPEALVGSGHLGAAGPSSRSGVREGEKKSRKPRRPHTSAGPRDKSNFAYTTSTDGQLSSNPDVEVDSAASPISPASSSDSRRLKRESGLGESLLTLSPVEGRGRESTKAERERARREKEVRAWEAELERIESASRKSSAGMLGSWGYGKRRKVNGAGQDG